MRAPQHDGRAGRLRVVMITLFPAQPDQIGGGVEGAAATLVEALGRTGQLDLHVLTPRRGGGPARQETAAGATIHRLPHPRGPGFLTTSTLYLARLQRAVDQLQPDVVHTQGMACWMPRARARVLTVHGIAERDVLHSHRPLRRLRSLFIEAGERLGRRRSDHTILINPYVRELLGDQLRGQRWHIANPVARAFFEAQGPARAPHLLYVGRITALKNIHGLLEVFARVRARVPEATLTLAGEPESPDYLRDCQRQVAAHGLQSAVRFAGAVPRAAMTDLLASARCLALLSNQEMAPLVVSEAQAAGVPSVCHAICGLPHMIAEGETGFLTPQGDVPAAADRIVRLLTDDALLDAMSAKARASALRTCQPDEVARRTLEVYAAARGQRCGTGC